MTYNVNNVLKTEEKKRLRMSDSTLPTNLSGIDLSYSHHESAAVSLWQYGAPVIIILGTIGMYDKTQIWFYFYHPSKM